MKKNYILFIDSGLGGLSTLAETIKLVPSSYIYFADNLNAPYGDKSIAFLKSQLCEIIEFFTKNYNISMIVLACNTATTTCISFLRKQYPNLCFVGTEPAINLAKKQGFANISVTATPQTINRLSKQNIGNYKLIKLKNLAKDIEHFLLFGDYLSKIKIYSTIYHLKSKLGGYGCLVLGCTHYPLLKPVFEKIIGIPIIDGNIGVSTRIYSLHPQKTKIYNIKLALSAENGKLKENYKKILRQILANQLNLC